MKISPEYQQLLPKLSEKDYESLKDSIRNEGLHFPIVINQDSIILDGHNRFQICQELGIIPRYEVKVFENPLLERKFVIEANLTRRHLNDFQRAELGMSFLEIEKELAKQRQEKGTLSPNDDKGRSHEKVAKAIGVSSKTFERCKKVIEKASETTKAKVRSGQQSINSAYSQITEKERLEKRDKELETSKAKIPEEITPILGDFREIQLPSESIQLILTDPPYREEDLALWDGLASFAEKMLVPGGFLIAYCPHYHLPRLLEKLGNKLDYFWTFALVHKQTTIVQSRHVFCHWKPIIIFNKKPLVLPAFFGDKIEGDGREKEYHKDQQGLLELESIITNFCPKNGIILDPFAGSGTTLLAAKRLGRKSIGIENDPETFETMKRRLGQD